MKCLDLVISDVNFKLTVTEDGGERWIPIAPICEAIGVDGRAQRRRLEEDTRFEVRLLSLPSGQGTQESLCITVKRLEVFLFTINTRATTKPHVRERLRIFQSGLADMIHAAFNDQPVDSYTFRMMVEIIKSLKEEVAGLRADNAALRQEQAYTNSRIDDQNEFFASAAGRALSYSKSGKRSHLTMVS